MAGRPPWAAALHAMSTNRLYRISNLHPTAEHFGLGRALSRPLLAGPPRDPKAIVGGIMDQGTDRGPKTKKRRGSGGGGGRGESHRHAAARPAASPTPALNLPLPEGGVHIDGSMLEGGMLSPWAGQGRGWWWRGGCLREGAGGGSGSATSVGRHCNPAYLLPCSLGGTQQVLPSVFRLQLLCVCSPLAGR